MAKKRYIQRGFAPTSFNDVDVELETVSKDVNDLANHIPTEISYEAPLKTFNLQIVYADGVSWNPGKGAGLYYFMGGSWRKLAEA